MVVQGERKENGWTTGHLLKELLHFAESDRLYKRYAKCLSYLRHTDIADKMYDKALQLDPDHYWSLSSYGFHLFFTFRYTEAEEMFIRALRVSKYKQEDNKSICHGLARVYEELQQPHKAEKYYKLSILSGNKCRRIYEPSYFYYSRC